MKDSSASPPLPTTVEEYRVWYGTNIPAGVEWGECFCGCGERTKLSSYTKPSETRFSGEPLRYKLQHHSRKSPIEYIAEDRGYETPCWIWQRATSDNGYGKTGSAYAHRVYYEQKYGAIPDTYHAHHLCTQPSCVNPDHIQPLSVNDHARTRSSSKLTKEQVEEIRILRAQGYPAKDVAARYGVHPSVVSKYAPQSRYKGRTVLTKEQKAQIHQLRADGYSVCEVAERFGIHGTSVSHIAPQRRHRS